MKNLTLIAVILLLSACNACKNPNPAPIKNYPVNDTLKAAFNFKVGTYWIYRDSISGEIDSFFVTNNEASRDNEKNFTADGIQIKIQENDITSGSAYIQYWNYNYGGNEIVINYFGGNMQPVIYSPFIDYPFQFSLVDGFGDPAISFPDSVLVENIFSSYNLNGNVFTNVAEVNHWFDGNNTSTEKYNDVFYICPSAGIIKMMLNHPLDGINRVWEIQRWNIVK